MNKRYIFLGNDESHKWQPLQPLRMLLKSRLRIKVLNCLTPAANLSLLDSLILESWAKIFAGTNYD